MPIFVLALKPNTYMDIEQLKFTHQKLLDHLESCNYNKVYVKEVKIILAALFDEKSPILSYEDYWERIVNSRRYTKFTLDLKRMYLNTVRAFDEYGHLPNGRPCAKLLFSSNYKKLNPGYKFLMDELRNRTNIAEENLPKSAKYTTLALFLLEMQIAGAVILNDVTDKLILDFFMTGKRKGSKHTQSHLRLALNQIRDLSPDIPRIISLLPKMKSKKRNYNNLRESEVEAIKNCLSNPLDNRMTLREKAIVALALYTGIRGCDIANIKSGDIDWENEEIRLIQVKTGQPLVLPLSANVGNALLAYILHERNADDRSEYVFPNKVQPGKRLSYKSIGTIVSGVFDKLGLRPGESHRGIGVFRHNLATRLLGAGTESVIISGIRGHTCPQAVEAYVDSDITHLRELGLSIEKYPLPKTYTDE